MLLRSVPFAGKCRCGSVVNSQRLEGKKWVFECEECFYVRYHKAKWAKTPPNHEGWYWITYIGKHGRTSCPALVLMKSKVTMVASARGDTFVFGRSKEEEKRQGVVKFGPFIPCPR